jgi:hypothetical protein
MVIFDQLPVLCQKSKGFNFIQIKFYLVMIIVVYLFLNSALIAYSSMEIKESNDLLVYGKYYNCLLNSGFASCSFEIGSEIEYFFYIFTKLFSFIFIDYKFFILFYSFFIFSSVFLLVLKISEIKSFTVFFISIFFLLTDFRFYDLGNNVLRHGLSVSMMLVFIYLFINKKKLISGYLVSFLPVLSHISSVGHFVLFINHKLLEGRFFWIILGLSFYFLSNIFLKILVDSSEGLDYLFHKLMFYSQNGSFSDDWLPFHYIVVVIFTTLFINQNPSYMAVRKVFLSYVLLSIVFIPLDMSYRFASFMSPLMAILIAFQIDFIVKKFNSRICLKFFILILFLIYLFFIVNKNFDFLVKGF